MSGQTRGGRAPRPRAPVRHDVVDHAPPEAGAWRCALWAAGRAAVDGPDEADLAWLATRTRTGLPRGEPLRVRAPGTTETWSVSAARDWAAGRLLWRTDATRCAHPFWATRPACAERSTARGQRAVLLVDHAQSHRVGKTGLVGTALDAPAGRVVLVFPPASRPDRQPRARLGRPWRPNVSQNHQRRQMPDRVADRDAWLTRMAAHPTSVLQALGLSSLLQPTRKAA